MSVFFIAVLAFGWKYPVLGFSILACLLLGIAVGLFKGRYWCNWYCPRGSFYDAFAGMFSPHRRVPALLRGMPSRITVLGLLMAVMLSSFLRYWPHPERMGMALVILVSFTTLLGLILAFFLHERTWCMVCPVGTMIKLTSRNTPALLINSASCIECKRCSQVCPMQIRAYDFRKEGESPVTDKDCLGCGLCVAACPTKALRFVKK